MSENWIRNRRAGNAVSVPLAYLCGVLALIAALLLPWISMGNGPALTVLRFREAGIAGGPVLFLGAALLLAACFIPSRHRSRTLLTWVLGIAVAECVAVVLYAAVGFAVAEPVSALLYDGPRRRFAVDRDRPVDVRMGLFVLVAALAALLAGALQWWSRVLDEE